MTLKTIWKKLRNPTIYITKTNQLIHKKYKEYKIGDILVPLTIERIRNKYYDHKSGKYEKIEHFSPQSSADRLRILEISPKNNLKVIEEYDDPKEQKKMETEFPNQMLLNSLVFGCTSFLTLDKKHRGKGYGMALIQESLQVLHKNGGLGAYFINSVSRCDNSIKLNNWHFSFNSKIYNNFFQISKNNLIVEKITDSKKYFDFYIELIKDKKFGFYPSYSYWKKWIVSFPTYIVLENNQIIGIFIFDTINLRYQVERKNIRKGVLLTCLGKQPETLQSALSVSKDMFYVLDVYETGDMSSTLLSENKFQKYDNHNYIIFFNTKNFLQSKDFYVPIF